MAWLAVDKNGKEFIYDGEPFRYKEMWVGQDFVELPKGSIEKLIGRKLTWEDEAVEIK